MMINRRRMMGGEALPYDAEIEYLESNGNQWIDTGVIYNIENNYEIVSEVLFVRTAGTHQLNGWNAGGAFGITSLGTASDGSLPAGFGQEILNIKVLMNFVINTGTSSQSVLSVTNGTTYSNSRSHASLADYARSDGYGLFACRSKNTIQYPCKEQIYNTKMYVNNTLVRDFIPIRVGQVGYMYDKVSGQLFGNAGTGNFILGPDVN